MLDQRKLSQVYKAAKQLVNLVEAIDQRAMAVDGPVTPTPQEMTSEEEVWFNQFVKKIVRAA